MTNLRVELAANMYAQIIAKKYTGFNKQNIQELRWIADDCLEATDAFIDALSAERSFNK
jgi:hypothetical protein